MFVDKILMITGGTGSFGNAMLHRMLRADFKEIRIFSRDEKKQEDMRLELGNPKVKFYIGDVRDYESVSAAMEGADYVFHAAALKQVPSCEFFPMEAVKTNILGADNVLAASIYHKVKRVVVLSTDKAVYPINAMGMTKALMEKTMIAKSRSIPPKGTILCGTRYGNVMASRGSVVPLFIKQIREGQPITVTDPKMTRFLMTLDDSIDLVFYAFRHACQGDIFVQKAPASTILDMALALKDILGGRSQIRIIGTRHGEKLYETLLTREELAKAEDLGEYYRIIPDGRDLNYNKYFTEGEQQVSVVEDYSSHNARRMPLEEVKRVLMQLEIVRRELEGHPGTT